MNGRASACSAPQPVTSTFSLQGTYLFQTQPMLQMLQTTVFPPPESPLSVMPPSSSSSRHRNPGLLFPTPLPHGLRGQVSIILLHVPLKPLSPLLHPTLHPSEHPPWCRILPPQWTHDIPQVIFRWTELPFLLRIGCWDSHHHLMLDSAHPDLFSPPPNLLVENPKLLPTPLSTSELWRTQEPQS